MEPEFVRIAWITSPPRLSIAPSCEALKLNFSKNSCEAGHRYRRMER
jgi:hypothetical protein